MIYSMERFESRIGTLSSSAQEVFNFISDLRNFERFIPQERISDWKADKDSCSFSVPSLGSVELRVVEKEPFTKVIYSGKALSDNKFDIYFRIFANETPAKADLIFEAELNPLVKMMISESIQKLLDTVINEMESFNGWGNAVKDTPLP